MPRPALLVLVALAALLFPGAAALFGRDATRADMPGAPTLRFAPSPSGAFAGVQVEGLPAQALERAGRAGLTAEVWQRFLHVRAELGGPADPDVPPMIGRYEVDGGILRFVPHAPARADLAYRAVFDRAAFARRFGGAAGGPIEARFRAADPAGAAQVRVEGIFPAQAELPANALRLYVHFSAPMGAGQVHDHVALLDADGREVPGAFLRVDQELWDATGRRLTLLFDPGRIKRGLRANREDGAPLRAGQRYRLVIAAGWRDEHGRRLAEPFEKRFTATADDRTPPDVASWQIAAPAAGTLDPLRVRFGEPLDHALAARALSVLGPDGHEIAGAASVEEADTTWRVTPAVPWQAGAHTLVVSSALEDLAGNSLDGAFDRDLAADMSPAAGAGAVRRSFRVERAPSMFRL